MTDAQDLKAGYRALSKYVLIGKIAQGGMAEVYLAYKNEGTPEQELVVLKRVQPELLGKDQFIEMFKNEAEVASLLEHPNVISIYEFGQDDNEWFMAMEYLDGRDMLQIGRACRKRKKAVPFEVTARILAETCEALNHAHHLQDSTGQGLNLVHRDMSPENIFLTFDGDVKILDFGIAKSDQSAELTQAGQVKGKLGYVAPEAIKGKKVDHRGDIYAMGATLYLFLTGRPAVQGNNPLEIFENALKSPTAPTQYNPHIPLELENICLKAMAVDPDDRYQSATALKNDFDNFLATRTLQLDRKQRQKFMSMLFPKDKDSMRLKVQSMMDDFQRNYATNTTSQAQTKKSNDDPEIAEMSIAQTHDADAFKQMATQPNKDASDAGSPFSQIEDGPPTKAPDTGSVELSAFQSPTTPTRFSVAHFIVGLMVGGGLITLTHYLLIGL
jgi:eukaryotic-like serine/threonine-protein kinase